MAEAARTIDRLDVSPAFSEADAAVLERRYSALGTRELLQMVLTRDVPGRLAAVSSFGAESAVLLHLIASVDPATPVIFVDTLKMFDETLEYRKALIDRLGLTDTRIERPDPVVLASRDQAGERWSYDPDGCCDLRKVVPLRRALASFDAWISGRKGFQANTRTALPRFEIDEGRLKINPLADWDKVALDHYFGEHDLPRHPLEGQGYLSIGCAPCTTPVRPGEDPRAGRWRGADKVECGIHDYWVSP